MHCPPGLLLISEIKTEFMSSAALLSCRARIFCHTPVYPRAGLSGLEVQGHRGPAAVVQALWDQEEKRVEVARRKLARVLLWNLPLYGVGIGGGWVLKR